MDQLLPPNVVQGLKSFVGLHRGQQSCLAQKSLYTQSTEIRGSFCSNIKLSLPSKVQHFSSLQGRTPREGEHLFPWLEHYDKFMVSEYVMNAVRKVKRSQFFNIVVRKPYQFTGESQMATGQIKFLMWYKIINAVPRATSTLIK